MSKSKLVKKLDAVYSKYIRNLYANDNGYVECYTCGVHKHVKEMQCGHFQSRRHYATRWHENNTRPQCPRCNLYSQGEQYIFGEKLKSEIGEVMFEELIKESKKTSKYTLADYKYLIDYYTKKLKDL